MNKPLTKKCIYDKETIPLQNWLYKFRFESALQGHQAEMCKCISWDKCKICKSIEKWFPAFKESHSKTVSSVERAFVATENDSRSCVEAQSSASVATKKKNQTFGGGIEGR